MEKKLITTFFLFLPLVIICQSPEYQRFSHYGVSRNLDSILGIYVSDFGGGRTLDRNSTLDSFAKVRANYFLDVMEINSTSGKSFFTLLKNIPKGNKAHYKCFGDSLYFRSPKTEYPENFPAFPDLGIEIKGEIMQEAVWGNTFTSKVPVEKIIDMAISKIEKDYGNTLSGKILESYKKSESHDSCIKQRGHGKYGLSTRILVSEINHNGSWIYEVMVYNLIVFTGDKATGGNR